MASMKEIAALEANRRCADCGIDEPDWTSINLGVFLCIRCAGIHRNLGVHHSKVRSIDLDTSCWDDETVAFMRGMGNAKAARLYEWLAPSYYFRPSDTDSPLVRENWIRAKYVRKEFVKACQDDQKDAGNPRLYMMPERAREGELLKLNPKNVWQKRWFVLHRRKLLYFKDGGESFAKGEIDVSDAEIVVPDQADSTHTFTFELHTQKKVYPLCAPSGEVMFNWLHALRRARHYYREVAPGADLDGAEAEAAAKAEAAARKAALYRDVQADELRGGELSKQGGHFKSWNRRYVVVSGGCLYYYKQQPTPADSPEGALPLAGCDVADAETKTGRRHCFSVISPGRVYFFIADSSADAHEWVNCLRQEIDKLTTRTPVDFRANTSFDDDDEPAAAAAAAE